MDEKELLHKVLQIIKDIENYTDTFISQETIPLVEVEIALDKTKNLYDTLHQMKRTIIHSESAVISEIPQPIESKEEEAIDLNAIELSFESNETKSETIENIEPTPKITISEEPSPIQPEIKEEKTVELDEITVIKKESTEIENTAEIPSQEKISKDVQSKFQIKHDADLGSKLGKKPLLNISSAIGINDRFQYIKELFNNDVSVYNSTIQTLNSLPDIDAAVAFIQKNFTWDLEDSTVQSFLSIVERRYL